MKQRTESQRIASLRNFQKMRLMGMVGALNQMIDETIELRNAALGIIPKPKKK